MKLPWCVAAGSERPLASYWCQNVATHYGISHRYRPTHTSTHAHKNSYIHTHRHRLFAVITCSWLAKENSGSNNCTQRSWKTLFNKSICECLPWRRGWLLQNHVERSHTGRIHYRPNRAPPTLPAHWKCVMGRKTRSWHTSSWYWSSGGYIKMRKHTSVCLSTCLSVSQSICMSVCPSVLLFKKHQSKEGVKSARRGKVKSESM